MVKTKYVVVRLTEAQDQMLRLATRHAGFSKKSEYVRCMLFRPELIKGGKE